MNFSIIAPFYNEQNNISIFNEELNKFLTQHFKSNEIKFELIYVDDGSKDNTFVELKKILKNKYKTKIFRHLKNYSQSSAIMTGIKNSTYNNLIFLDGDCQNDPKDIYKMIKIYEKGYDLVNGWRKKRNDNFFLKCIPSYLGNFFIKIFTNSNLNDHGCALKIIKKDLINSKTSWGDFHRLLGARLDCKKFKITEIVVNHRPRINGKSNYNLSRIFNVILDLLFINFFKNSKKQQFYFFDKHDNKIMEKYEN